MFAPPQQQDTFSWNNPDLFGAGSGVVALAPDAGYSFGMPSWRLRPWYQQVVMTVIPDLAWLTYFVLFVT